MNQPKDPDEVYSPHTMILDVLESKQAPTIITREGHSVGKSEDYKRSDHPDFMTSSELKAIAYCGVRHNSITDMMEIWVLGEVAASMSAIVASSHPQKWERLYADTFGLHSTEAARNAN